MRKFCLLITALLVIHIAQAQYEQDSAWVRDNYIKKEVYIPMRDGVKLFTAVYIPKDVSEKHPILMTRTPYSCSPYGENKFHPSLWQRDWKYFARENYIFVI